MDNNKLVELVRKDFLYQEHRSPSYDKVLEAMKEVDRKKFLPPDIHYSPELAYTNMILPIGHEQTCSEPALVAYMAYLLELEEGMKVLEVGSGCGYSAAITSELIGPSGYLVTVERIAELVALAQENLEAHFGKENLEKRLKVIPRDGSIGVEEETPFDRIYLTAGVELGFDPFILAKQLNSNGGILLFPEKDGYLIKQVYKKGDLMSAISCARVNFVPLIGQNC